MRRQTRISGKLPAVCRLGLATRGGSRLQPEDARLALDRGVNYWNWCGHPDGLSQAVASLAARRSEVVVAAQFQSRTAGAARREFEALLRELQTGYIDILTMYYVESANEWDGLTRAGGVRDYLLGEKESGRLRMIGLTTHQRKLAAEWSQTGLLDMVMIRYNAAHRGAEEDLFPVLRRTGVPAVTFTGLRWKALLQGTPDDPSGFEPPAAAECYRFCLANKGVSVALAAPGNRVELEHTLSVLDDWRAPDAARMRELQAHGDRVRRHAGMFP